MCRRCAAPILLLALALGVGGPVALAGGARDAAAGRAQARPRARARARGPQLSAQPAEVRPGETVVLRGRGFPRGAAITLLARPPHGEASPIGSAQAGRRGGFSASIQIRVPSDPSRYVVLACHDSCRVKAETRFRVLAP